MKRIFVVLCIGGMALRAYAFVPFFFGARSLSLGQGTMALNFDANAIFINPALLSRMLISSTGLQYQQQYFDYKNFGGTLSSLLGHDLKNWSSLSTGEKEAVWGDLNDLFGSRTGMNGFQAKNAAFATTDFGVAITFVDEAIVNPGDGAILAGGPSTLSSSDIAGLKLNLLGWHYTQYSLSYALPISQSLNIGATVHYLYGQVSDYTLGLLDPQLAKEKKPYDYLSDAWGKHETDFSCISMDVSASATLGGLFFASIIARNVFNPTIVTSRQTLTMPQRVIAALACQTQDLWGIYLDLDVKKTDLHYNGKKSQPISFGVEKGFMKNLFSLRAGFLNDLAEDDFFGSGSNILYGLGLGFNPPQFQVDVALGINSSGTIKSLAISGFYIVKGRN